LCLEEEGQEEDAARGGIVVRDSVPQFFDPDEGPLAEARGRDLDLDEVVDEHGNGLDVVVHGRLQCR